MDYRRGHPTPSLWIGLAIVAAGVLLLLAQFNYDLARTVLSHWPLALVGVGLLQFLERRHPAGRVWGVIFIVVGGILELKRHTPYLQDVSMRDLWPLFIIGLGLLFVWRALSGPGFSRRGEADTASSSLNEWAVFGGGKRTISARDFQGGEITAVFGGQEIDLHKAEIKGESAVLRITAVFGGAEIHVPDHWDVTVRGVPIFGGVEDKTTHPRPDSVPAPKRLIIDAVAVFGGIEVKN